MCGANNPTVSRPGFLVVPSRIFQIVVKGTPDTRASRCIWACESCSRPVRMTATEGSAMLMTAESTEFGRSSQPHPVDDPNYRIRMSKIDSKVVLWENVSALMKAKYGKENLTRLALEGKFGPGTSSRIKQHETSVGLDVLDSLAHVFKVEPWQLLVPNFDFSVDAIPLHKPTKWPFPSVSLDSIQQLPQTKIGKIEGYIESVIDAHNELLGKRNVA